MCQIFWLIGSGITEIWYPKIAISHWLAASPLQQCTHCRATLWCKNAKVSTIGKGVFFSNSNDSKRIFGPEIDESEIQKFCREVLRTKHLKAVLNVFFSLHHSNCLYLMNTKWYLLQLKSGANWIKIQFSRYCNSNATVPSWRYRSHTVELYYLVYILFHTTTPLRQVGAVNIHVTRVKKNIPHLKIRGAAQGFMGE